MTFFNKVGAYIYGILIWSCTMLAPSVPYMLCIGGIVAVDTITGSFAATIKRGEKFNSRAFGRLWQKLLVYMPIIIMSFFIEVAFFKASPFEMMHNLPITYITSSGIAFNEIVSIDENYTTLTGKSLLGFIKKFVLKLLPDKAKLFEDKEENNQN
jgi:Bacteriophage holin family